VWTRCCTPFDIYLRRRTLDVEYSFVLAAPLCRARFTSFSVHMPHMSSDRPVENHEKLCILSPCRLAVVRGWSCVPRSPPVERLRSAALLPPSRRGRARSATRDLSQSTHGQTVIIVNIDLLCAYLARPLRGGALCFMSSARSPLSHGEVDSCDRMTARARDRNLHCAKASTLSPPLWFSTGPPDWTCSAVLWRAMLLNRHGTAVRLP